jgi:glutamate synthase domain-containing protein 3
MATLEDVIAGQISAEAGEIDCTGKTTREINRAVRALLDGGARAIRLRNPAGRHNLAVGLTDAVAIECDGPVGYFFGGMMDGPRLHAAGNCGWSVGEDMLSGEIVIDGYAGSSAAAAMRGGTVVIRGDAGARAGVSMKGGTLLVGGSVGYMSGFMMQKGSIIICGDAGPAIGDSMYEGQVFVAGAVEQPGNDAVVGEPSEEDNATIAALLSRYGLPHPGAFKKLTAGRRLWNFSKKEIGIWIEAL